MDDTERMWYLVEKYGKSGLRVIATCRTEVDMEPGVRQGTLPLGGEK